MHAHRAGGFTLELPLERPQILPVQKSGRALHVVNPNQPHLSDQPVLQHPVHPRQAPLGWRDVRQDQCGPKLLHRPPKLRLRRLARQLLRNAPHFDVLKRYFRPRPLSCTSSFRWSAVRTISVATSIVNSAVLMVTS